MQETPLEQLQPLMVGKNRIDLSLITNQEEFGVWVADQRNLGPSKHNRRPMIATHGVKRNTDLLGH